MSKRTSYGWRSRWGKLGTEHMYWVGPFSGLCPNAHMVWNNHNKWREDVSNHWQFDLFVQQLIKTDSMKTKSWATSPLWREFSTQRASISESNPKSWHHHEYTGNRPTLLISAVIVGLLQLVGDWWFAVVGTCSVEKGDYVGYFWDTDDPNHRQNTLKCCTTE